MEETVTRRRRATRPITHYWGMVKDMDEDQKLELVTMLIDSVRLRPATDDEDERERGFRSLAGCWANDEGDDDMEAIIREGRDLIAVTDNLKHFNPMPGVDVENWIKRPAKQ